jgi:hypothetical protein
MVNNNGIPSHNLMASLVGISGWDLMRSIIGILVGTTTTKSHGVNSLGDIRYMEHPTGNPWDTISTIWL